MHAHSGFRFCGIIGLCAIALLVAACSSGSALSREERRELAAQASQSADDFLAYLEGRSFRVQTAARNLGARELVSSAEEVYTVNLQEYPGTLYIYEYASEAAAEADAQRLDFGSLQTVRQGGANFRGTYHPMVTTQNAPVYRKGSLIVAYFGREVAVQNVLREAMGAPIR